LTQDGITRQETKYRPPPCDVDLPPGKVFLSVTTLGTALGRQGGVAIEQMRFLIRRERRIVGVFSSQPILEEEEDALLEASG
ncbi:hypothetical protein T484DRAFT_1856125, partial [Baffinella frigidus]